MSCTSGSIYKPQALVYYLYLVPGVVYTNQRPWYNIYILYLGKCIQTRGRGILSVSCTWGGYTIHPLLLSFEKNIPSCVVSRFPLLLCVVQITFTRGRGIVYVSCTWGGVYKPEAVVWYLYIVPREVYTNQMSWYNIYILYLGKCIQTRGRGILSVSCTWGGYTIHPLLLSLEKNIPSFVVSRFHLLLCVVQITFTRGRGIVSVPCTWGGVYKPEAVV